MKKNFKKALSVLLVAVMLVSVFAVNVFAAGPYTITFNNKNADKGQATFKLKTDASGKINMNDVPYFTREGYTQINWSTSSYSTSSSYYVKVDSDGYYKATKNITLYPVWQIKKFNVTYEPGASADAGQVAVTEVVDYNKTTTVKDSIFTREGYLQTGWALKDGSNRADYEFGQVTDKITDDITLYPVWVLPVTSSEVSSTVLNFGYKCVDYDGVEPMTFTITNTGTVNLSYTFNSDDSEHFTVDIISGSLTLAPGQSVTLEVCPVDSLGEGNYVCNMFFDCGNEVADINVKAKFGVAQHAFVKYKLVEGSATYTHDGEETAECSNGCGATHTRTAVGSMKVFDAANNDAVGLSSEYNYHRTVRFTAYGSGYDNNEPVTGSKRFVPTSWYVNDDFNGVFTDGEFDVTFTHTIYGKYTLVIEFVEEVYDEETDTWTATGETDTKTFNYSVGTTEYEEQEIILPQTILSIIFGLFAELLKLIGIGQ